MTTTTRPQVRHSIIRGNDVAIAEYAGEYIITINQDAEEVTVLYAPTLEEASAKARAWSVKNPRQS